ncbi:MAG TPA: hypothetical protein VIH28_08545 [Ignavibacteriaceae bacterium]
MYGKSRFTKGKIINQDSLLCNVIEPIIGSWEEDHKPKKTLLEKIEKLKKKAEKEGMKCEVVLSKKDWIKEAIDQMKQNQNWVEPTFSATNTEDEWIIDCPARNWNKPTFLDTKTKDEWEFVKLIEDVGLFKKGQIFKVLNCNFDLFLGAGTSYKIVENQAGSVWINENILKRSTESDYTKQLIEKFNELFGDLKSIDNIDNSEMKGGAIVSNMIWDYRKEIDTLYRIGIPVYQSGKWAKLVKGRVRVDPKDILTQLSPAGYGTEFRFSLANSNIKDQDSFKRFLASQLEKYLND